jgi:molecular chaperone DnaK
LTRFTDGYGNPFPSLVIIDRTTGQVYSGREAWRRREELRESCAVIPSVKTLLASDVTWQIAGRTWTPEMVASRVFAALKERVKKRTGSDLLKEAVVAVPVGFPSRKRQALREAARLAGVAIKSFISEPTAALFYHYEQAGHFTSIGVFDWGGGTLDVSVIENRNGRIRELATAGVDTAGDYIDRLLAEWLHGRIARKHGYQVAFSEMPPEARDKMLVACEQAKRDLSYDDRTEIQLVNYGDIEYVQDSIDYESFSRLVMPVVDRALQCFESCVQQAGKSITGLDGILMVGGSVNLRPLGERIAERWQGKEIYPADAEWSVAGGAACLSLHPGEYLPAQTVGLVLSDGSIYPLVPEGKPVKLREWVEASFALVEDDPAASLVFSDGEGRILGYLNVPAFGFFREKILVSAQVDPDQILRIRARSTSRSEEMAEEWCYSSLRLDYRLPVNRKVVVDDEQAIQC